MTEWSMKVCMHIQHWREVSLLLVTPSLGCSSAIRLVLVATYWSVERWCPKFFVGTSSNAVRLPFVIVSMWISLTGVLSISVPLVYMWTWPFCDGLSFACAMVKGKKLVIHLWCCLLSNPLRCLCLCLVAQARTIQDIYDLDISRFLKKPQASI